MIANNNQLSKIDVNYNTENKLNSNQKEKIQPKENN